MPYDPRPDDRPSLLLATVATLAAPVAIFPVAVLLELLGGPGGSSPSRLVARARTIGSDLLFFAPFVWLVCVPPLLVVGGALLFAANRKPGLRRWPWWALAGAVSSTVPLFASLYVVGGVPDWPHVPLLAIPGITCALAYHSIVRFGWTRPPPPTPQP